MPRFLVHQIFYDDATRQALEPEFIPLDNFANERPDWYELWPIRRFLHRTKLDAQAWYGFLSPKFAAKTGLNGRQILGYLEQCAPYTDVALLAVAGWDQLAYFLNPFEQGEFCHPGLLEVSQRFVDTLGLGTNLRTLLTDATSSVFCNSVVARPAFWQRWLRLADALFDCAENPGHELFAALNGSVDYAGGARSAQMKVFVQERLATLVLAQGDLRVAAPDFSDQAPLTKVVFANDVSTRRLLQACEVLKQRWRASGDGDFLQAYAKLRYAVPGSERLAPFRALPKAADG